MAVQLIRDGVGLAVTAKAGEVTLMFKGAIITFAPEDARGIAAALNRCADQAEQSALKERTDEPD